MDSHHAAPLHAYTHTLYNISPPYTRTKRDGKMYWLRFSKFVQYLTTFVMHVISVTLTFDIFFSPQSTAYLYEDLSSISVYHRNASNRYWFVFSSLISMLLLGLTIAYYTFSYGTTMYTSFKNRNRKQSISFAAIFFSENMYKMNLVDFGFVSVSIAWNIIWAIHLLLQIVQTAIRPSVQHIVSFKEASLLLLLSTQITLIALRYPSLFQEVDSPIIYGLVEDSEDKLLSNDIIQEVGKKSEKIICSNNASTSRKLQIPKRIVTKWQTSVSTAPRTAVSFHASPLALTQSS